MSVSALIPAWSDQLPGAETHSSGSRYDIIPVDVARTLPGLFRERVRRSPDRAAYRYYDSLNETWVDISWRMMAHEVARWQSAMETENLGAGDCVALMARNSRFWVMADLAAAGLGLITVPLYTEDRACNVQYILQQTSARLLIIGGNQQWQRLREQAAAFKTIKKIISIGQISDADDKRITAMRDWLPDDGGALRVGDCGGNDIATIIYTSGTTGVPKGVMLTHKNFLANAASGLQAVPVATDDSLLSFLPLSHALERTVGYYLPVMAGACVAHARGIAELAEDLQTIRPTGLIAVPRIFERMHMRINESLKAQSGRKRKLFRLACEIGWRHFNYRQGLESWHASLMLWPVLKRLVADKVCARLGGRLRFVISGGAALSPDIARQFIGLGIPIVQGYGLTEAAPVVSVNRREKNIPASIGPPLPGVEVRLGENDELMVRGDNVMRGYWKNPNATDAVIDADAWLHTGDKARIDEDGYIYITGRLKEIIALATGEKVSPADMEMAIAADPVLDQILVIGEGRPYLCALVVPNPAHLDEWVENERTTSCTEQQLEELLLERIASSLTHFPGYAQIRRVTPVSEPWSVDNDLQKYRREIERMYEGHTG